LASCKRSTSLANHSKTNSDELDTGNDTVLEGVIFVGNNIIMAYHEILLPFF